MDEDKLYDYEKYNMEDLTEGFIEKYSDLWSQYVYERFEVSIQTEGYDEDREYEKQRDDK